MINKIRAAIGSVTEPSLIHKCPEVGDYWIGSSKCMLDKSHYGVVFRYAFVYQRVVQDWKGAWKIETCWREMNKKLPLREG